MTNYGEADLATLTEAQKTVQYGVRVKDKEIKGDRNGFMIGREWMDREKGLRRIFSDQVEDVLRDHVRKHWNKWWRVWSERGVKRKVENGNMWSLTGKGLI